MLNSIIVKFLEFEQVELLKLSLNLTTLLIFAEFAAILLREIMKIFEMFTTNE